MCLRSRRHIPHSFGTGCIRIQGVCLPYPRNVPSVPKARSFGTGPRRLCAAVVKECARCARRVGRRGWGLASGVFSLPRWCVCVALCLGVSLGSWCRCWLRVVLMCFQLMQLSCLASGDSALWRGIWRRPVPSSRAGGDVWCCMRAVGCLGASFVWVGTSEPLMLASMHQSTWVGKVEG